MGRVCQRRLATVVGVDRRSFLRAAGLAAGTVGAGGLLAACGRGSGGSGQATDAVAIPDGAPSLSLVNASFETLTGTDRRLNLVALEDDATPIEGADLAVFVRTLEGAVRSGPHAATWYPEQGPGTGTGTGLYQVQLALPEPGALELVGVIGDRYGTAAVNVVDPVSSQAPAPGEPAVSTPTPTEAEPLGFERICTRTEDGEDEPCPMHEASLEALLEDGRPVMLLFATPAYCQTVACGPSVDNLMAVRASRDWGDVAFVHVEIYESQAEAGSQPAPPVQAWGLPTEPWLFAVARDGTIADRLDGPMLDDDMTRLAEQVV